MAFDFGERRIGVAFANTETSLSTPLATLTARDSEPVWTELDSLIAEWRPRVLVAGLPYNIDGGESAQTKKAKAFAEQLRARYDLPVEFVDERLTSVEAEEMLRQQRRAGLLKRRVRREDVDSQAACLIAESWLRSNKDKTNS